MRIAFLGDSLTEGWPGAAYFPLLDRSLPQHELSNHGRAGDTVADLWARMRSEALDPVDLAFIWVGANDAVIGAWDASEADSGWSWPDRLARIRGDYDALLEWTEARAKRLVLVRPIVFAAENSLWETRAEEMSRAIGAAIGELAAGRSGCRELDLAPSFAVAARSGSGSFTIDGVHFTDAGAEVVTGAFAAVIAEVEAETAREDAGEAHSPDSGGTR
jgi:lysophospholipase L1-like esterase